MFSTLENDENKKQKVFSEMKRPLIYEQIVFCRLKRV
jgi:hypothetical protein